MSYQKLGPGEASFEIYKTTLVHWIPSNRLDLIVHDDDIDSADAAIAEAARLRDDGSTGFSSITSQGEIDGCPVVLARCNSGVSDPYALLLLKVGAPFMIDEKTYEMEGEDYDLESAGGEMSHGGAVEAQVRSLFLMAPSIWLYLDENAWSVSRVRIGQVSRCIGALGSERTIAPTAEAGSNVNDKS